MPPISIETEPTRTDLRHTCRYERLGGDCQDVFHVVGGMIAAVDVGNESVLLEDPD